jgi:hypothetical protein
LALGTVSNEIRCRKILFKENQKKRRKNRTKVPELTPEPDSTDGEN